MNPQGACVCSSVDLTFTVSRAVWTAAWPNCVECRSKSIVLVRIPVFLTTFSVVGVHFWRSTNTCAYAVSYAFFGLASVAMFHDTYTA